MKTLYDRITEPYVFQMWKHELGTVPTDYIDEQLDRLSRSEFLFMISENIQEMFEESNRYSNMFNVKLK